MIRLLILLAALVVGSAGPAIAQPAGDGPPLIPRVMMLWPDLPEFQASGPEPRPVEPGLFAHDRPVFEVLSPDEDWFAGTEDGGFYIRPSDADAPSLMLAPEGGPRWSIADAKWAPGSTRLAVRRVDERGVPRVPLIGAEGDTTRWVPYSRAGEPQPKHRLWIIDRAHAESMPVPHGPGTMFVHPLAWSTDGTRLRYLEADRLLQRVDLREFDVRTGETRLLLREADERRVMGIEMIHGYGPELDRLGPAAFFDKHDRFVWASERSGERQLYLYEADGTLVRELTAEALPGPVQHIAHVDHEAGTLYAVAAEAEQPWNHALYRVDLDGDVRKVIDGPVIEAVRETGSGDLLVLRAGFPDLLQVDRVTPDGEVLGTPWTADWSFLGDLPRRHERLILTSADGETPLDAVLILPADADAARSVPLIDFIYGGPNALMVPRSPQTPWLWEAYQLAEHGMAVLFVDGRGTPGRERTFVDVSYGQIGQVEAADHIAAVEQVLGRFPVLDPERVGIMGHSVGGYNALRAMAEAPELFRTGVLIAPVVDAETMRVWVEPYMGCLPTDCPDAYAAGSNRALADRIEGSVLILHGTADDDVPFAEGEGLAEALEAAGVDVTFVPMPGWNHILQRSPTFWKRVTAFLGTHLP